MLQAFYFPEDVGLGIGGDGEPNVYILAIQYENEKLLPGQYIFNIQAYVKINKIFERKIVNIFLPINFNRCIETVLLSTYNICFG